MFNIARNELHRLFLSPLAWIIMGLCQIILAYLFLSHIDVFVANQGQLSAIPGAPGVTDIVVVPLLSNAAIITLLVTPLVTMRSLAEERRNETLPLLASAPLSMSQIVLGKYIGSSVFFSIIASVAVIMPLSLLQGTDLDFRLMASGTLGLLLLIGSFNAIGLFLSSLTKQPTIAAISTFSLLFLLWIIDWAGSNTVSVLSWLSLLRHYEPLLAGQVNTMDIAFYLLIISSFILLTIRKLDGERINS